MKIESRLGGEAVGARGDVHGKGGLARHHDEVAIGAEPVGKRPFDFFVRKHVDILVDHSDVLEEWNREQRRDCGAGRFRRAAAERHARVQQSACARHGVDRSRSDAGFREDLPDTGLGEDRTLLRMFGARDVARAVQHGLVQRVAAHGDRGRVEHGIDVGLGRRSQEFAIRPFDLGSLTCRNSLPPPTSASAGTRSPFDTARTIGSGAPRNVPNSGNLLS